MTGVKGSDDLIPTGRFAEASRLSLKALRIYDRLGLLRPVHVDRRNRYRYYHPEQIHRAKVIGLLRSLEVPLEAIRDILEAANGAQAVEILNAYWREVEERTDQGRRVVAYLEEILGGGEPMGFAVKTRQVAGAKALSIIQEVYVKDLEGFIVRSIRTLHRRTAEYGDRAIGHPTVIYHGQVNEDSSGPVEVCLPVDRGMGDTEATRVIELPAGTEAYTTITWAQCRFPEILRAYDAVHAWMKQNGRVAAGPPREIYFSDQEQPESDAPFCDVAWPIR